MTDLIIGWALIAAAVFVIAAAALAAHKHPARQDGPEPLPERGSNPKRQCDSTGCAYAANVWVIVADDLGGGVRFVCHGCADEGEHFAWWRARLPKDATPLDFEGAGDLERLEAWANGEAS